MWLIKAAPTVIFKNSPPGRNFTKKGNIFADKNLKNTYTFQFFLIELKGQYNTIIINKYFVMNTLYLVEYFPSYYNAKVNTVLYEMVAWVLFILSSHALGGVFCLTPERLENFEFSF